jgi:hypothetical protein
VYREKLREGESYARRGPFNELQRMNLTVLCHCDTLAKPIIEGVMYMALFFMVSQGRPWSWSCEGTV